MCGWKLINVDSPGNTEVYGGDDIKKVMKLLSGYDLKLDNSSDVVDIDTETSFSSEKLRIKSPSTGFNYIFKGQDITADRVISLPLMDDDGEISLSAVGAINDWGASMQTFRNQNIAFRNPANTFSYIWNTSAITDNRNITLPLLTADDEVVTKNHTQTLTNKTLTSPTITAMTIDTDTNTIKHSTTNNNNDLLMYKTSLSKYDRFERGAANQFLAVTPTGTALEWRDISSISGGSGGGSGDPLVGNTISGVWYGTTPTAATGVWNGFITNMSTVTPTNISDTSGRIGLNYALSTDNAMAGFRSTDKFFTRLNDPELWVRYKYTANAQDSEYRIIMGFVSDMTKDYASNADNLANTSAFCWYKDDVITENIHVGRNDGDASQDNDSTVFLAHNNETIHTIRLFSDSTNNRFGISLDGATATYFTTEIPASTTRLGTIIAFINDDSNARNFELYGAYFKAKVL
jgi:hypothetical protein